MTTPPFTDDTKVTVGTTNSNENNTVEQKISRPDPMLELILLFWVDEPDWPNGGSAGRKMFSEAAQTRMKNIKKSSWYDEKIHKIHNPPIQVIHEIGTIVQNWINHYGGKDKIKTREIGVFSHVGENDGPISYYQEVNPPTAGWKHQMSVTGWQAIDFNWKDDRAFCVFYGCKSGLDESPTNFGKKLSAFANFKNVIVWGQSTSSYPSFFPDYRVTTLARNGSLPGSWNVGATYMIGGNPSEGWKSTNILPRDITAYPRANPLNYFSDAKCMGSSHQGIFNDHRRNV